jgi:hypothetical protein
LNLKKRKEYEESIIMMYGDNVGQKLLNGHYWIGMTEEMARVSLGTRQALIEQLVLGEFTSNGFIIESIFTLKMGNWRVIKIQDIPAPARILSRVNVNNLGYYSLE